jgi:hypothetical protein
MLDIDVNHWRNLQSLLLDSAKGRRRIIVIHENGKLLKFVHSHKEEIVKNVQRVDNPRQVAEQVFKENEGKADFVLVFERNAFDRYTADFQDTWNADEDLDEFVRRQFRLTDNYGDGIVTYPRPARETLGLQWRVGTSFENVRDAVNAFVPANSSVALGVFEGDSLWATLILRFDAEHRADVVTTVDVSRLSTTKGDRKAIAKEVVDFVNSRYPTCSLGLFTDLESAQAFIASDSKLAYLTELARSDKLIANPVPEALADVVAR